METLNILMIFQQLYRKYRPKMFAHMSKGIKKLQIAAFRLFIGSLANSPQVF